MIAGYLRVSTAMQDAQRQREELADAFAVEEWFGDVSSGSNTERDAFQQLMDRLDEFDKVVVWESSRLTRSLDDFLGILNEFEERGVKLETLGPMPTYDPDDPMSRAMIQVIVAVQEIEREQIRQRIQSGVDRAKEQGKHVGTVPFGYMTNEKGYLVKDDVEWGMLTDALDELMKGRTQTEVAEEMEGISQGTLSRVIKRIEEGHEYYDELEFDREEWEVSKARA